MFTWVDNTMYIYKLVFDVQGKVCWKSIDKTCATNESMSFYKRLNMTIGLKLL